MVMKEKRTAEYVAAVIANIVVLVFMNTVMLWQQSTRGVVLESWVAILWAADLSLGMQILGNLFLAFYRPAWLSALMQALFSALGVLGLIVFFTVFPLDFSRLVGPWLNTLLRVVLVVGMVGSIIAFIVSVVRFFQAAGRTAEKVP